MQNLEDLAKFPSENPNPILRVTKNKVLYVNKAGEKLFSIKEGEKVPILFQSELTEALNTNILKTFEVEIGNLSYILDIVPIKEEGYANIYGKDITERRKAEEALRDSEQRLKDAQALGKIGDWEFDVDKQNLLWSDQVFNLYKRDRIRGMPTLEEEAAYYSPKEAKRLQEYAQRAIEYGQEFEYDLEANLSDGSIIQLSALMRPIKNKSGRVTKLIGIVQDITARKIAEQNLKESEKKYRTLIENAQEGIWTIDENSITSFVNPRMAEMLGYTQDEMLGKHLYDFIDEKNIEIAEKYIEHRKQGLEEQHDFEFLRKDGMKIYTLVETSPLMDTEGKYEGALAFVSDITARKKIEQSLKESQKKYKLLSEELELILDHIVGPVFFKDKKNSFIWVNKYIADAYRMKREDLIGKSLFELYPEEVAQTYLNDDLEVINSGKPKLNIVESWNTFDGLKWILTSKIPYVDENRDIKGIIGTSVDITERRNAEIELKKSEATYREAYKRAEFYKDIFTHDINNILQNISNGIQLNEMYLDKPDKSNAIKRNINIIKRQVRRGANLVSNVRKLSKISESVTSLFIINCCDVLKKSINYIKNAFQDKNIKIEVQISENNFKILANELLEDVFDNLLTNSINYNDSEVINIEVKANKELRQGINYIKMQFIDNGIGITDERKHQIFTRGYSEETSVHGMGLGLSLVKKIIESYTGEIWMEDRVKGDYTKGTNCIVLIPEVTNNG